MVSSVILIAAVRRARGQVSPFERTLQTQEELRKALQRGGRRIHTSIDSRIREQESCPGPEWAGGRGTTEAPPRMITRNHTHFARPLLFFAGTHLGRIRRGNTRPSLVAMLLEQRVRIESGEISTSDEAGVHRNSAALGCKKQRGIGLVPTAPPP